VAALHTEYKLAGEEQEFFAEFLPPLIGDGLERDGSNDVTVKKAGITAQKLRYLEVLLISPWSPTRAVCNDHGCPPQRSTNSS